MENAPLAVGANLPESIGCGVVAEAKEGTHEWLSAREN